MESSAALVISLMFPAWFMDHGEAADPDSFRYNQVSALKLLPDYLLEEDVAILALYSASN